MLNQLKLNVDGSNLFANGCQCLLLDEITSCAQRPNSSTPRPFLKWAGSKRHVLKHLIDLLPKHINTYYEPFLGTAALFFLLKPRHAVLNDFCIPLMNAFIAVRDNVDAVIKYLRPLKPNKTLFYQIRQKPSRGRFRRAAEFIYLNKVCWNGLYRVNSNGIFNVPYGSPKSNFIADFHNLKACSLTLQSPGVELQSSDFEEAITGAKHGDLVYFDPPYVTGHNNNGFLEYNETIFSWTDQQRLAKVAKYLATKGVHVIISNANHDQIVKLYPGFGVRRFNRSSTLASDAASRRTVSELLLFTKD